MRPASFTATSRAVCPLVTLNLAVHSHVATSRCPTTQRPQVSIVDTPGILSGEKQRLERNYSFVEVVQWFAGRADLILLLFDPYKLDISDEFKSVIATLRGHDDKVRTRPAQ